MIEVGTQFPAFSLPDQNGAQRTLGDYKGQWVVIYFYPKDDTPGCTIQGKAFTARKADFDALGATILGVSADDVKSHKSFCDKFGFVTTFLADTDATLMRALKLPQQEWNGQKFWERSTVVVDPKGVVRKTYGSVNAQGHEEALLGDLKQLQGAQTK